jgi:hypothetical protein
VLAGIGQRYRRFAHDEARGRSPRLRDWAEAIASDAAVLAFLAELPAPRRSRTCFRRGTLDGPGCLTATPSCGSSYSIR